MSDNYDLIIVGGGPAGIAAGIYAARQEMNFLLISKNLGGQMAKKTNWEKVLTESWVSNNINLSEADAEKQLVASEFDIKKMVYERENHEQLQAAKEIVKDLNSGFSAAIKYEKAKIEFLLERIENARLAKKG